MPGSGPGVITEDGCPVEVYVRLPDLGEAGIVHDAVAPGATVLDLGAGTGRIAHGLIARGHTVVAVDSALEMLAHVRDAETVCAPIAGLELGRRFDAVLLASHLLNGSDPSALLDTAARHLTPDGVLVAQLHPASWFDSVRDSTGGQLGEFEVSLRDVRRSGDQVSAVVRYERDGQVWSQRFTAHRIVDAMLRRLLADAGLAFGRWLRDDWFTAHVAK